MADRVLTDQLNVALALVEVRLLEHVIIGKGKLYSFAESGLL
jgi:DNA repair protein RadC